MEMRTNFRRDIYGTTTQHCSVSNHEKAIIEAWSPYLPRKEKYIETAYKYTIYNQRQHKNGRAGDIKAFAFDLHSCDTEGAVRRFDI